MKQINRLHFVTFIYMLSLLDYAQKKHNHFCKLAQQIHQEYPLSINQINYYSTNYHSIPIKDILNLIKIQHKLIHKFPFSCKWLFTEKNAQQASDYLIASYHGTLFKDYQIIADVCCGIGSDLLYLSKKATKCYAIDINQEILDYAKYNMKTFNKGNIEFLNIRAEDFNFYSDALFIDPDRRINNKRYIKPEDLSPNFFTIEKLISKYHNVAVKMSPAFDYESSPYDKFSYDFVSVRGELKECLLKSGSLANCNNIKKAVLLPQRLMFEQKNHPETDIKQIKEWILEPDPSIIRAHLINDLAYELKMDRIDPHIALLTSNNEPDEIFGKKYKVNNVFDYSLKKLNNYLKTKNIGTIDIKTKGFSESVESFRKKLKLKGNNKLQIFIVRVINKHIVIEVVN